MSLCILNHPSSLAIVRPNVWPKRERVHGHKEKNLIYMTNGLCHLSSSVELLYVAFLESHPHHTRSTICTTRPHDDDEELLTRCPRPFGPSLLRWPSISETVQIIRPHNETQSKFNKIPLFPVSFHFQYLTFVGG